MDHGFANDIDGLIQQVIRAYNKFCPRKIDFVGFPTLQSCLDEILASNGSNTYSIPPMGKEKLLDARTLPLHVGASANAISVARQVVDALGDDDNNNNNNSDDDPLDP